MPDLGRPGNAAGALIKRFLTQLKANGGGNPPSSCNWHQNPQIIVFAPGIPKVG